MSAYDKFDYAKEAINLGVIEYLNKPVDRKTFIETIKKALNQIDVDRENRSRELEIKEKMETIVPIIENGLINNLLFQEYYHEDIVNFKKLLGIEADYGYMIAAVFGDEQQDGYMTNAVGTSVRIQNHMNDVREIVKLHFDAVVGSAMANRIAIFVPSKEKEFDYSERIRLIESARQMVRELGNELSLKFRISIGSVKPLDRLIDSYREALEGMAFTTGSVVHADDLIRGRGCEEDYPIDTEEMLFESVLKGDLDGALAAANQFYDWMLENHQGLEADIKLKVLEFVLWAEHLAYEKSMSTYHFRSRGDYLPTINAISDYELLRKWFMEKISAACQNIKSRKENQSIGVIDKAREYINLNFQNEISLDDVSREIDISPYYFSKIFKDQTGKNFIDYLTELRINKAKDLLENTDLSMKEICAKVGYSNPNYFSRTFKKNVGVSPTEYKH